MFFGSKLSKALKKAVANPSDLPDLIRNVSDEKVKSLSEAELVVGVLTLLPHTGESAEKRFAGSVLHDAVAWIQEAEDKRVVELFKTAAMPELLRIFDEEIKRVSKAEDAFSLRNDLMFLLKVLALYGAEGGLERVTAATRSSSLSDEYLWSVIFDVASQEGHPWQAELIDALRSPLPRGFAVVAYLDLVNTVAREEELADHPFNSEEGLALLQGWLSDTNPEKESYAHSAAAAIPFLEGPVREEVLATALRHPSADVRLEAAWAQVRSGDERGYEPLVDACRQPRTVSAAMRYLEELEAKDRIPEESKTPDFSALAEMCQWLAHPNEFGRPPEKIEQADTRELVWPPTGDRRRVWLFRYEYPPEEDETEPDIGYGMVGSVTFALFGETTADKTPEEVYALHCAWELMCNEDPQAPEERTVESGMKILAKDNPGFGRKT